VAEDMLFATLDPTLRRVKLPSGTWVILSDTVGFISDLPTHLVAAFRATLEEVQEADVVLHVRDIRSAARHWRRARICAVSARAARNGPRPLRKDSVAVLRNWLRERQGGGVDPRARVLTLVDAGHITCIEQPEAIAAALRGWGVGSFSWPDAPRNLGESLLDRPTFPMLTALWKHVSRAIWAIVSLPRRISRAVGR
jgi:hypothetical protein